MMLVSYWSIFFISLLMILLVWFGDGKEEDLCVSEKLSKQETEGRELAKDEEEKA